jgi:prepilin-type N-terminal cleavage/methylation domain-containing protein
MRQLNIKGFTLIEVLIVVAIFAIGAAIAIPNIMDMGRRGALKTDARQIKDTLAKARLEAINRNVSVIVEFRQPTNDYVTFIDSGATANTYDNSDELIQLNSLNSSIYDTAENSGDGITIGAGNSIVWDTKGMSTDINGGMSNGSIYLTNNDGVSFKIITNQTGNIRIEKQ